MADDTTLEFEGEVVDSNKGKFTVQVNEHQKVICTLSGKIRQKSIRILIGDKVKIEVSAYDPTKGRITYRNK